MQTNFLYQMLGKVSFVGADANQIHGRDKFQSFPNQKKTQSP